MVTTILPVKIKDASVTKKGAHLIGPIDLSLEPGGTTIVIGPNGSGKTTLLRLLHGLERPKSGSIIWNDVAGDIDVFSRQSFVFQSPIMMHRTVIANLIYPLQVKRVAKSDALVRANDALGEAGLAFAANRRATSLSGGEKQKLAIARALITSPEILFLDEPTTNLDGLSTQEIEASLKKVADAGTTIVMATHDLGQAKRMADNVIFMYRGKVHEFSSKRSFFDQPRSDEARAFTAGEIVL